jgi:hypothetical protein
VPEEGKFLAIKNWEKYQPNVKNPTYIRDYVNREDDREFAKLNFFQRGALEALCPLRRVAGGAADLHLKAWSGALRSESFDFRDLHLPRDRVSRPGHVF